MIKIIEYPKVNIVSCCCGCRFSYESEDMVSEYSEASITWNKIDTYIICPICKKKTYIYNFNYNGQEVK